MQEVRDMRDQMNDEGAYKNGFSYCAFTVNYESLDHFKFGRTSDQLPGIKAPFLFRLSI